MVIYLIRNKVNGKLYVGQTERAMNERWSEHLREQSKLPLYRAMKKHDAGNFEIIQLCTADDQAQADRMEQVFILICRAKTPRGYNLTDGGKGGAVGFKMRESTKAKLRAHRLGKKASLATRKKISQVQIGRDRGKVLSAEHRKKIGDSVRWPPARLAYEQALMRERMKSLGQH